MTPPADLRFRWSESPVFGIRSSRSTESSRHRLRRLDGLSNHLRLLRSVGAVEAEPAGRYTYYRLCPEVLQAVSAHYAALASRSRLALAVKRPCD